MNHEHEPAVSMTTERLLMEILFWAIHTSIQNSDDEACKFHAWALLRLHEIPQEYLLQAHLALVPILEDWDKKGEHLRQAKKIWCELDAGKEAKDDEKNEWLQEMAKEILLCSETQDEHEAAVHNRILATMESERKENKDGPRWVYEFDDEEIDKEIDRLVAASDLTRVRCHGSCTCYETRKLE